MPQVKDGRAAHASRNLNDASSGGGQRPMRDAQERSASARRRRSAMARREERAGWLFVSPQVLGFCVFVASPIIAVFVYSLQHRGLLTDDVAFAGLDNYRQMVDVDPHFRQMLLNTALFCAGLVPINVGLGLALALLLSGDRRGNGLFQALFFLPVITSGVAWAIVWRYILAGDAGPLNQYLAVIGVHAPNWLFEPGWALAAVTVTRALKTVGIKMVIFIAAIRSIPREHLEAARVDGANSWQVFRHIMVPHLSPAIVLVVIITMIGSMQVFDHILFMTGGGPQNGTMVLVYYVYHQAFEALNTGYASALAVVLFVLMLGLTLVQWVLRKRVGADDRA